LHKFSNTALLFLFPLVLCQCGSVKQERPLVVATTGMLADACRELLPDSIEVAGLMGPGIDPHLYKARQQDVALFRRAHRIVYNGLHLEGKLTEILAKMPEKTIAVAETLPDSLLIIHAVGGSVADPHIWQDPLLWKEAVHGLGLSLAAAFPELRDTILKNSLAYQQRLDVTHQQIQEKIATLPDGRRTLVTAHNAFAYFGKRYGLEVVALLGVSTVAEFGLKDISDLVSLLSTRKIPAVFLETSISPRSLEAVIAGCKERGHNVRIGGTLYSDALGGAGSGAETTLKMLLANTETIVKALNPAF
jgi:manganese/zinc/iron transport system substrate-binding protein